MIKKMGLLPVLLMTRTLHLGGTERQLCDIALRLDRSLFRPHVACFHATGFRADELRDAGVAVVELPVRSFRDASLPRGIRRFGAYLREQRIQLVHTFDVPLTLFGVPCARMFQVPVVLSSARAHRTLVSRPARAALRLTDGMVDAIVVNSQAVRRHLVEDERVPDRLIHVCHNGVDTNRYRPGPRCPIPELGGNSLVVGVVSAFRPEKDLPALLEAFARVRHLRPGLKLALVGDGPELERLRRDRDRLKLAESCHIEPATNDVPRWLRAIDIFVLPSLSEAFSNSLMEAMASGCCAVASQTGGNPELVEHGRTGLLFRPGDAGELAACLRLLIENDALRNQYAAAGADFMHENFSLQASAQRMGEIYRNAMMST